MKDYFKKLSQFRNDSAPSVFDENAEDRSCLGWCSPEFPAGCVQNEDAEE